MRLRGFKEFGYLCAVFLGFIFLIFPFELIGLNPSFYLTVLYVLIAMAVVLMVAGYAICD